MLSAIITDVGSAEVLEATLATLQDAATDGLIRELIIIRFGDDPAVQSLAEEAGAAAVVDDLAAAVSAMRQPWGLVLPAGVRLQAGWQSAVTRHARANADRAGFFRHASAAPGFKGRFAEALAASRTGFGLAPMSRQGLVAPGTLLQAAVGADGLDDLLHHIGRRRLRPLAPSALAS
jgi:hypothetical protein